MAIPQSLVDKIMVRCARHCCVCRRYRPLNLHVHHIDEKATGGDDAEDNLIATCANCHADVHAATKLTRRFTPAELRLHRDSVYQRMAEGRLPAEGSVDGADVIAASILAALGKSELAQPQVSSSLSSAAVELLLAAVQDDADGMLGIGETGMDYRCVLIGNKQYGTVEDNRACAKYRAGLQSLSSSGLVERDGDFFYVTDPGYRVADTILSTANNPQN